MGDVSKCLLEEKKKNLLKDKQSTKSGVCTSHSLFLQWPRIITIDPSPYDLTEGTCAFSHLKNYVILTSSLVVGSLFPPHLHTTPY